MKQAKAFIYILLSGILWGCLGLFVRSFNAVGIESMDIVFLRGIVTALAMIVYLLIFHREMLHIRLKDIWCFLGTGIASITFFNFCYFKAIELSSMSAAAVLLYTAPAIVMVLSFFLFKELFTKRKILAIVLTFIGCILVTGIGSGTAITLSGLLYGLGAGLGYALYSIFSRYALDRGYHSLTITCYTFVVTAIASGLFADIPSVCVVTFSSGSFLLLALALGILCTVAPYLLYTLGLRQVDNSTAAVVASIEPVTATVLGLIVYGEGLTLGKIMGIILVLAGLFVTRNN